MTHLRIRLHLGGYSLLFGLLLAAVPGSILRAAELDVLWTQESMLRATYTTYGNRLQYSPDGQYFAFNPYKAMMVYRASDRSYLYTLTGASDSSCSPVDLSFTSDSQRIVALNRGCSSSGGTFLTFRASDGEVLSTTRLDEGWIQGYSADEDLAFTLRQPSSPETRHIHQVWQISEKRLLFSVETPDYSRFDSDGQIAAVMETGGRVRWWRISDGTLLGELPGGSYSREQFMAGPHGISIEDSLLVVRLPDRTELRRISDGDLVKTLPALGRVDLHSDRGLMVTYPWVAYPDTSIPRPSLWIRNGEEWLPAPFDLSNPSALMLVPGSPYLLTDHGEENIRLWHTGGGSLLRELPFSNLPLGVSPDGTVVAVRLPGHPGDYNGGGYPIFPVGFFSLPGGESLDGGAHNGPLRALAFSPDGKILAAGGKDHKVRLWDARTGKHLLTVEIPTAFFYIRKITFSPDGSLFFAHGESFQGQNPTVYGWRVEDGLPIGDRPGAHLFSPDGGLNAYMTHTESSGYALEVRRTEDGALLHSIQGGDDTLKPLAFTPDGGEIVVRRTRPSVTEAWYEVWDIGEGRLLRTLAATQGITVDQSDGTLLVLQKELSEPQNFALSVYEVASGQLLHHVNSDAANRTLLLADPAWLRYATLDPATRTLRLWSLEDGQLLQTFNYGETDELPVTVEVTPDRKALIAKGHRETSLWNIADGRLIHRFGSGLYNPYSHVTFSPTGGLMAYVQGGGTFSGHVLTVAASPVAGEAIQPGDVNADGQVDVGDAVLALRFIVRLDVPTPREQAAADMSQDAQITIQDVILILQKVIGL